MMSREHETSHTILDLLPPAPFEPPHPLKCNCFCKRHSPFYLHYVIVPLHCTGLKQSWLRYFSHKCFERKKDGQKDMNKEGTKERKTETKKEIKKKVTNERKK